jgi:hypothetical protein
MKIDFNNPPGPHGHGIGDPHWLSGSGKVDRKGNHKHHQAAHIAAIHARPRKPARPETTAKLEAVSAHAKKTEQAKLVKVWNTAISILDRSEVVIRDLIERELADIAGLSGVPVGDAMQTTKDLMDKVRPVRQRALKKAFRYLREKL